jgi:CheY-like chemotaxis protein
MNDLRLDRAGGLWVIGDTNLTRINPKRSISVFDHENGLPKSYVAGTVRYGGDLYAATGNGLYRLEAGGGGQDPAQFRKVLGITDWVFRALAAPPYGVLLTSDKAVYLFDGTRFQVVLIQPFNFAIARSRKNPDRFFLGGGDGLHALRFAGSQWVDEGRMPGLDRQVTSVAETANGNLIVGTISDGYFPIQLSPNPEKLFDGAQRGLTLPAHHMGGPTSACICERALLRRVNRFVYHRAAELWSCLSKSEIFGSALRPMTMMRQAPSADGQIVGYEGSIRSVLVVDDDRSNRDVIKQFLAEVGFAVAEADSGDTALGLMRSRHFDGVISDIRMTGKDGNALCREVRSDGRLAQTVMIASSASVYDGDHRDAESAGFDDFLPKPVKEQELLRILKQRLGIKWVTKRETGGNGSPATDANQTADSIQRPPVTERDPPTEQLRRLLILAGEGDI